MLLDASKVIIGLMTIMIIDIIGNALYGMADRVIRRYCIVNISMFILLFTVIMTGPPNTLSIAAWNMNCNLDIAKPYLTKISTTADIIAVSEHGLFPCELHKLDTILPGYSALGKSSRILSDQNFGHIRGTGGCAILWDSKKLNYKVRIMPELGSDRMCVIELSGMSRIYYIISVYMPHQSCYIANYTEELNSIQNIVDKCSPQGQCVILGDFNVHFGAEYQGRCWGTSSQNANKVMQFIRQNNMCIVDIGDKGSGESYSYSGWHGNSYLDHCVVSENIVPYVEKCEILTDEVKNVSDHLALVLHLAECFEVEATQCQNARRVAWHRLSQEDIEHYYTIPLEEECCRVLIDAGYEPGAIASMPQSDVCTDEHSLNNIICSLTDIMKKTDMNLPQNKYNKRLKPYWDRELNDLVKTKKHSRQLWINNGRPRDSTDVTCKEYKDAKRNFRKENRRKKYEFEKKSMRELADSHELDNRFFWYTVNRHKNRKVPSPIRNDNGILLNDPNDIANEWNKYYETLYNESEDENYDDDFRHQVLKELDNIESKLQNVNKFLTGGPLSTKEIDKILKTMKNNKAPGWDQITAEHLKYSGWLVKGTLTWAINNMIYAGIIPDELKKGLLVPIPKPKKDHSVKDNNRGITLLPVMYKLVEKIIIERETSWLSSNNVCDEIQSCGKAHCSSMHTSFVVQEAIAYNVHRGETVYGAFLDTRKAFDTVWIRGLLYKLYHSGINIKAWIMIRSSYTNFTCAAMIGGILGRWFTPQRGIHQGAPLSMQLYTIYINDLILQLKASPHGLHIGSINVTCPAHADDICILALFKTSLNVLMNIANIYSFQWRYSFNHTKTVAVIWGRDRQPKVALKFGGKNLQPQPKAKHMGIQLYNDTRLSREICAERVGAARQVLYCARGLGSTRVPVDTISLSKIYWSVGMPKMTYGLDIVPLNDQCLQDLELAHRHHARVIQCIPENTPRPAVLATLGWLSVGSYVSILQIMFMIRILCMPANCIYRKILVHQINWLRTHNLDSMNMKSPVLSMYKNAKKYGLENCIIECVLNGHIDLIPRYKNKIKSIIWEREKAMWKSSIMMYKELNVYTTCVLDIKVLAWWRYVQKVPHVKKKVACVVAVLLGSQPKGMQRNIGQNICRLCGIKESPQHILFHCSKLARVRSYAWDLVLSAMPMAMAKDLSSLNPDNKTVFFLSGLNTASFIEEWADAYYQVANYVYCIYKERMLLYDEMG